MWFAFSGRSSVTLHSSISQAAGLAHRMFFVAPSCTSTHVRLALSIATKSCVVSSGARGSASIGSA